MEKLQPRLVISFDALPKMVRLTLQPMALIDKLTPGRAHHQKIASAAATRCGHVAIAQGGKKALVSAPQFVRIFGGS